MPGSSKPGGAGKGNRNPAVDAAERSDTFVVPKKPSNKGSAAEMVEGRDVAKGNAGEPPAPRTQSRTRASMGLEGVREVARCDKRARFTALLHHITPGRGRWVTTVSTATPFFSFAHGVESSPGVISLRGQEPASADFAVDRVGRRLQVRAGRRF